MGSAPGKMPSFSPSPICVLSLLLLLLGAVATQQSSTQQSEVSTPFFEEDAELSVGPVSPDNIHLPSPFDEAAQPKRQEQNQQTQEHEHPMPDNIDASPLSSWSSWLRTIFTNALRLLWFDVEPPIKKLQKTMPRSTETPPTLASPDSCQLKPGVPVGYKTVCEGAKDAAACAALSLTCVWGQPTPTSSCSGSSEGLPGSECLAWQAFYDATGGGGCSRDDPCACTTWGGDFCEDGHIVILEFHGTSISGSIPESISALTALVGLYLQYTSISGSIPESISALTALKILNLQRTSISGSIPQSFCSLDIPDCELSIQGSPTYACPLPSCTDKLSACHVTSCQ